MKYITLTRLVRFSWAQNVIKGTYYAKIRFKIKTSTQIKVSFFLFPDPRQQVTSIMQITKKQMKTFNRINEKLRTIPRFFITNYGYLLRKYSYLKKSHYIVKCQLKLRKQRVVLLFNQLKKLGLNKIEDKEGKKQYSKKSQKKCHLRSRTGTVQRSSLPISKPNTENRAIEKTNADKKVSTVPNRSKAPGSAESVTVCHSNSFIKPDVH